jgi:hypothetical protein
MNEDMMNKNEGKLNLIQLYHQACYQTQNILKRLNDNVQYFVILIYSL